MPNFFPERQATPNPWQILGQGLQSGAGLLTQYDDDKMKEAQQRNLLQDMVEKRTQAKMDAILRQQEEARANEQFKMLQAEAKKKDEFDASKKKFQEFAAPQQVPVGPVLPAQEPPQPSFDVQPPGQDFVSPLIQPRQMETQRRSYPELQDKAAELGVYGDPGVKEFINDRDPAKDPDFLLKRAMASRTANRAAPEALGRITQRLSEAGRAGINLSRQDLVNLMAAEDPTGEIFGTREGQQLLTSRSTAEAIANSLIAANRFGFEQEKFGYTQKEDATEKATKFAKNTSEMATIDHLFGKLDKEIPGGIYGTGGISGFGFGTKPLRAFWKTQEANRIRPTLQSIINKVLKKQSGAAVSDQEFDRLQTEYGINTTGTIEEFRQGLQNAYEVNKAEYDTFRAADPETAAMLEERLGREVKPIKGSPEAKKEILSSPLSAKPGLKAIDGQVAADYLKRAGGDRKKAKLMLKKDGYDIDG